MDPHSKSLKWPSKLLNIHSTRLIKKNPPKESKLRRHKLQEISTPRINNIPINAQNPHNNPLREGLVVVSDMAINQYMPFAKSSSAARIFFGSRQDIGHTRAYSGTPQGRFTPRTLQSRPFLTPFNWHTRNLVNAPQGLNVNIHSPFGAGNHMVPKCAGSFCAYSRIRVYIYILYVIYIIYILRNLFLLSIYIGKYKPIQKDKHKLSRTRQRL